VEASEAACVLRKRASIQKVRRGARWGLLGLGSLGGGTRLVFPAFPHGGLGASLAREAMRKPSPRALRTKAPRIRATSRRSPRLWSAEVTRRSNALDLQPGVFTWTDPKRIAASLKRSAQTSRRKKTDSYRSALSMLSFYINRAGANLSQARRRILTRAKGELRKQFGRVGA
jgi:Protein of unknown function (DUF3175)